MQRICFFISWKNTGGISQWPSSHLAISTNQCFFMSHDEMHCVCFIISWGNAWGNLAILSFFLTILLALSHPPKGTQFNSTISTWFRFQKLDRGLGQDQRIQSFLLPSIPSVLKPPELPQCSRYFY